MIFRKLVVGPLASNCYIIGSESGNEGIIIDPGAEGDVILNNVRELALDVKYIVLTHGHMDHVGALKEVKEVFSTAEIVIHSAEAELLREQPVSKLLGLSPISLPLPDRLLEDGETIHAGGLQFLVLHTPGHTSGGICLLVAEMLFSGDTLFNCGVGRTDLPTGSYDELMNSIHTKLLILPDNATVYPGHGPDTTIGAERQGNPFLHG